MKSKKLISAFLIFSFLLCSVSPLFSEETNTTPKKYEDKEFPQGLKDLRRFEIVTLGSVPFVTLDTTLAYSTIRYAQHNFDSAYQPDIFSKSNFTQDEQKQIIATSICISLGIGLTDYIFQLIKRSSKKRRAARQITYDDISIVPISEDPDASQIPLPSESSEISVSSEEDQTSEVQEIEE